MPSADVPRYTVTVLFASAVPVKVIAVPLAGESELITGDVGAVVSICNMPVGVATAPVRLAALPTASTTVAELRLTAVTARSDVFCPAATV